MYKHSTVGSLEGWDRAKKSEIAVGLESEEIEREFATIAQERRTITSDGVAHVLVEHKGFRRCVCKGQFPHFDLSFSHHGLHLTESPFAMHLAILPGCDFTRLENGQLECLMNTSCPSPSAISTSTGSCVASPRLVLRALSVSRCSTSFFVFRVYNQIVLELVFLVSIIQFYCWLALSSYSHFSLHVPCHLSLFTTVTSVTLSMRFFAFLVCITLQTAFATQRPSSAAHNVHKRANDGQAPLPGTTYGVNLGSLFVYVRVISFQTASYQLETWKG